MPSAPPSTVPSTPAGLVRDHRDDYLRRKLARSPMLNFMPGTYRMDASTLFDGIRPNLPSTGASGVSDASSLVSALIGGRHQATVQNIRSVHLQKLLKMKRSAEDVRHSTGQHALYLGYPCVLLPGEAGKNKFAPIFLFAVELAANSLRVQVKRAGDGGDDDGVSEALINRLLVTFVEHHHGVKLAHSGDAHVAVDNTNIETFVAALFAPWRGVARDWQFPHVSPALSTLALKALRVDTDDPRIVDHAVIGLADFSGQSLIDDLDEIEASLKRGEPCSAPLKKLLDATRDRAEPSIKRPENDQEKFLVERSDPSQEDAIWALRQSPLVVLQGPPGTGKSQTIVNTVADAIANHQNVLVVCQKRAATEVVKKRLDAVGLGDLASLVDDIDTDRAPIIMRIKEIDREFSLSALERDRRKQLAIQIADLEQRLEAAAIALSDDGNGNRLRHADLQARLTQLGWFDPNPKWSSQLKKITAERIKNGFNRQQLAVAAAAHGAIDAEAQRTAYPNNSWSNVAPALAEDALALSEIQQQLRTAVELGERIESKQITPIHDDATAWVAEHPWFVHHDIVEHGMPHPISDSAAAEQQQAFNRWLGAVRHLALHNEHIDTARDCAAIRNGCYGNEALRAVAHDAKLLPDIASLRSKIASDPLLNEADHTLRTDTSAWAPQLQAVVLHDWRRQLLSARGAELALARNVENTGHELRQKIAEKRAADSTHIKGEHLGRRTSRDILEEHNLLRLRGRGPVKKTSLRALHHQGAEAMRRLQPILLTSPENASSLIPLVAGHYDLVIIDEASQMFVAEAIPMLFRAKRALIAGDREQMPPSDTFAFSDDTDDDDEFEAQQSSTGGPLDPIASAPVYAAADRVYRLLDAADSALGSASPNKRTLQIHYRSARRELIDFSNHAFYEGKLVIPSGNAPLPALFRTAITFEAINGVFIKGINEAEAARMVEWVVTLFALPESERPTAGIIVNNIKQKARIEELLADYADADSAFATVYASERDRVVDGEDVAFFVRSVENVQGDERDVILFGATYSGDKRGFGPLSASGDGRKRLNVAVTRAKRAMVVLCSLNLNATSNTAERDTHERYYFWQYLRYARAVASSDAETVHAVLNQLNPERRTATAPTSAPTSTSTSESGAHETDSPFEDEVKIYIESLGYHVTAQVGESGFRIDLGVKCKADDLNFLCGVECDGAPFHSGWTARTRDVWRQDILESKGWTILRIWSTRWYDDPAGVKDELAKHLAVRAT